jgi:hypothetical protein
MRKLIFLLCLTFSIPAWSQVVSPPDRAYTTSVRPTISADYNTRVREARIWVDGTEFTHYARVNGDTVTLVPPYNLDYGTHQVAIETSNGRRTAWSFDIVRDDQAYRPGYDPYYYPNSRDPRYYPNNSDPRYYPNNDPYYYPNDPYYYPDNDGRLEIEDILPSIIRLIPNR